MRYEWNLGDSLGSAPSEKGERERSRAPDLTSARRRRRPGSLSLKEGRPDVMGRKEACGRSP